MTTEIEVRVDADRAMLAGTLWLPAGHGPYPALLMIGGSGPTDRHNDVYFPPTRKAVLDEGVAVASFDKRGVGESTGDWLTAPPAVLIGDTIAEFAALRERPELDPDRIGLFGHSQGGWLVIGAAAAEPRVAFAITSSGPGTTPGQQELYAIEAGLARSDMEADGQAAALAFANAVEKLGRRQASWEEVERLLDETRRGPWWPAIEKSGLVPPAEGWAHWLLWVDHDPRAALAAVRQPLLALFGEADPIIPVAASIEIFRATRGSRAGLTIEVVPGGNHRMSVGEPPSLEPTYLPTLVAWIRAQVAGERSRDEAPASAP
jgi:pimeloyl-ACP methyl ester carboxylesterase